jgi:serine protease Do
MKNDFKTELSGAQVPSKKSNDQSKPSAQQQKLLAAALLFISSISAGFVGGYYGGQQSTDTPRQSQGQQIVSNESELITKIANDMGQSVVSIDVTRQATRQSIFGAPRSVTQESAGTGVIISQDGVIITNRHVIPAGATSVSITLADGTELNDVEVIGRTNEGDTLDVAFLKIKDKKGKELKPAKLGDSSKVKVGDKVIAIGNALGQFQNTVTSGIISGYGRSVEAGDEESSETLQNLFQTDTAINQGNSGGPLVNVNGEVIGLNTAVAGGSAQNIGFAIPINDVQGLIKGVLKDGKLLRPYLGVRYVSLTDDYAYEYNLQTKRGSYIVPNTNSSESILPGSPAEKAGLKEKDIITKVNNQTIDEKNSLISVLGKFSVGEKVSLTIVRDGKEHRVDVTLEAAPQS